MSVKAGAKPMEPLELARFAVELARKKGAAEAAATTSRSRDVDVQWRDGKLDRISEATSRSLTVQLYVDGRYSAASTNDTRPEALDTFITDSIALTRVLAADEFRKLPDPEWYQGRQSMELEIDDGAQAAVTADQRRAYAREAEEAARAADGKGAILSVTSDFADTAYEYHRVASNGFEGSQRGTRFSGYASVSVKDTDRRPEEYDYSATRMLSDLGTAAVVGKAACERALSRLRATKAASAALPMIVDNRVAGRLVSMLMGPLSGQSVQQKRSYLDGKLDQKIGSALLDITDDPFVKRGMGSRHFDGEGMAAKVMPVVEKGVLRAFYIDNYYGRKLGSKPTTGSASNLSWKLGSKGRDALIADQKDAILVTSFIGGNSNGTTGDFSLGIQGFRVSKGKIGAPISEMNIAGTQVDLWKRLVAVGNDPFPYSSLRTPTLVFDKVSFAGT
jgi:PmbA protein